MKSPEAGNGVLTGNRVIDFTDEKGMYCSRLLADMGADVIKIENPDANAAKTPGYIAENFGKKSVTLNVDSIQGQTLFKRLVKTADILVESRQPGYMESLGLDYGELSKINPRLIMASITGFGQNGPYRDYKSGDIVASALGGWLYLNGEKELPPLKLSGNQAYYTASLFAANGIMLALYHRQARGKGQHIDISLQECVAATLDHALVRYFYREEVAERQGGLYWNNAFSVFECRDGYILLTLFYQWETLVNWLDAEGMAEDLTDKKWLDSEKRNDNLGHIISVLTRWTKSHYTNELVEKGQLMRFPWIRVNTIPEVLENTQLKERGFFQEVELEEPAGSYKFPRSLFSADRPDLPASGQDLKAGACNREIYRGELGLSEEEYKALTRDGVI